MLPLLCAAVMSAPANFVDAPKLTIVISIDQFRRDYIGKWADLFLPPTSREGVGGFRWLSERGANFVNSAYSHVPTETGPGHAIIGTGSDPSQTGIIGNEWFDKAQNKVIYCVADPATKDIFTGAPSYSPRNLEVGTFCDELERATAGLSRTASVSFKDRAAILMAGRAADDVVWFDTKGGNWTTSDFYERNGQLPTWAAKINSQKLPDKYIGQRWETSLPAGTLKRAMVADNPGMPASFGKTFPHKLEPGESYYFNWQRTPWGNEFVLNCAASAVSTNSMGKDGIPDLLTVNLSSNDFVGHWFGPDSPEALEITVKTDQYLADFFRRVDKEVGLENTLIVLTADHGVMSMAEEYEKMGQPGGRINYNQFFSQLAEAVRDEYGGAFEVASRNDQGIYLKEREGSEEESDEEFGIDNAAMFVRDWLRARPEVYAAFTKWEFEEQKLPETQITKFVECSYFPKRSPDVAFFTRPGYYLSPALSGTGHGSPWIYDRAVPLLMAGKWIEAGRHDDECGPKDIAATLCAAWGIIPPTGSVGRAIAVKNN
jgi:hypothetical protein